MPTLQFHDNSKTFSFNLIFYRVIATTASGIDVFGGFFLSLFPKIVHFPAGKPLLCSRPETVKYSLESSVEYGLLNNLSFQYRDFLSLVTTRLTSCASSCHIMGIKEATCCLYVL